MGSSTDAVDDFALVRDVVVESHRVGAEMLGEQAHGQGSDALGVGDGQGTALDPLPFHRHTLLD
jgi:hypothetical protein